MGADIVLEGLLPIHATLEAGSRAVTVIYLAEGATAGPARRLERAARHRDCPVVRVSRSELDGLAPGRRHGGALALAGPRRTVALDALLGSPNPFLAMLDGVEDPYNFGQAVRALYASGADGILVGPRDWAAATAVVARASAGASERIPLCPVDDVDALDAAVRRLRAARVRIVCADRLGARPVYEANLRGPLLLVLGGERRGIRRPLARVADERVTVPYGRAFDACLDVTSATAVIAFEVARQRAGRGMSPTVRSPCTPRSGVQR